MQAIFSRTEARRFYDRFGARQDRQGFYEDAALDLLVASGAFESARAVVEFGCGTGRFAARLLRDHLDARASYLGFDLSETMVSLAGELIAEYGERARVVRTDGAIELELESATCDRFVANYVIEILPEPDRRALIDEAHRLLVPGGLLGLVTITPGCSLISQAVMGVWNAVHTLRPKTVGGCRAITCRELLDGSDWKLVSHETVSRWGIASEIVVARKRREVE